MRGIDRETLRRIIELAYEDGWTDACNDHIDQRRDPEHAIGYGKQHDVDAILLRLDRRNLLGLFGGAA